MLAIVVGTISSIQEAQAKYIFNQHSHTSIGDEEGEIKGNDGSVTNCNGELCEEVTGSEKYHSNTNDNTNRPVGEDGVRSHTNTHEMPNGNGNGNNDDE